MSSCSNINQEMVYLNNTNKTKKILNLNKNSFNKSPIAISNSLLENSLNVESVIKRRRDILVSQEENNHQTIKFDIPEYKMILTPEIIYNSNFVPAHQTSILKSDVASHYFNTNESFLNFQNSINYNNNNSENTIGHDKNLTLYNLYLQQKLSYRFLYPPPIQRPLINPQYIMPSDRAYNYFLDAYFNAFRIQNVETEYDLSEKISDMETVHKNELNFAESSYITTNKLMFVLLILNKLKLVL